MGHSAGTGGATEALGALGVWGPHEHLGLRKAGITAVFAPELEVGAPPQSGCRPGAADERGLGLVSSAKPCHLEPRQASWHCWLLGLDAPSHLCCQTASGISRSFPLLFPFCSL